MKKGEFYDVLSFLIKTCESSHHEKPSAVLMGPNEYSEYKDELASKAIQGIQTLGANQFKVHGVPIMLTPTPGVDIAFPLSYHERLTNSLLENEEKSEEK